MLELLVANHLEMLLLHPVVDVLLLDQVGELLLFLVAIVFVLE